MPGRIKKLLELGAREYITKPLEINSFLKIVGHFINERQENQLTLGGDGK
jgi:DNA-binding response OmpR family regulator